MLTVTEAWVRPTAGELTGFFCLLSNKGTSSVTVVGGSASFASAVELHDIELVGTSRRMVHLMAGISVEPGTSVRLRPGALHGMFIGLTSELVENTHISFELETTSGQVDLLDVPVRRMTAEDRLTPPQ